MNISYLKCLFNHDWKKQTETCGPCGWKWTLVCKKCGKVKKYNEAIDKTKE